MRRGRWSIGMPVVAFAAAAFALAALASAGASPPPDGSSHLLVVPASDAGRAALTVATGAREVARYKQFTLVEATGGDVAALQRAGASLRDDMREVRIGTRSYDVALERPALLGKHGGAAPSATKDGAGLAVVQYVGPIKDEWTAAVTKTGVQIVSYMAQNGQLVAGDDEALDRLAALLPVHPF